MIVLQNVLKKFALFLFALFYCFDLSLQADRVSRKVHFADNLNFYYEPFDDSAPFNLDPLVDVCAASFAWVDQPSAPHNPVIRAARRLLRSESAARRLASDYQGNRLSLVTSDVASVDTVSMSLLDLKFWRSRYLSEIDSDVICFYNSVDSNSLQIDLVYSSDMNNIGLLQLEPIIYSEVMSIKICTIENLVRETVFKSTPAAKIYAPIFIRQTGVFTYSAQIKIVFNQEDKHKVCFKNPLINLMPNNFKNFAIKKNTVRFDDFKFEDVLVMTTSLTNIPLTPYIYSHNGMQVETKKEKIYVECTNITLCNNTSILFSPISVAIDHVKGNTLKASFDIKVDKKCMAEAFLIISRTPSINDSAQMCAGTYQMQQSSSKYTTTHINTYIPNPNMGNLLGILVVYINCQQKPKKYPLVIKNIKLTASVKKKPTKYELQTNPYN